MVKKNSEECEYISFEQIIYPLESDCNELICTRKFWEHLVAIPDNALLADIIYQQVTHPFTQNATRL